MTDIYVDLPALQQLSNNLAAIYESLDSADDDFSDAEGCLGSSDVAGKLNDFSDGWKDGRKTIKEEINNLMEAVKGAYDSYLKSENHLIDGYKQNGVQTTTKGSPTAN